MLEHQLKLFSTVSKSRVTEGCSFLRVEPIRKWQCEPFIINIHYAGRWPSITCAFGLFDWEELIGIVTYGSPASSHLQRGIAGDLHKHEVLELNRLCLLYNRKNEASRLVGRSLKMLPHNKIIVSYADTEQGHLGVVYQATNFIYTGLSKPGKDWAVRGQEHLHSRTIVGEYRGCKNRVQALRNKYGDALYLLPRSRKHRYLYFVGDKRYTRDVLKSLKYSILPYPKFIDAEIAAT